MSQQIFQLLAGVGVLLFGINLFEQAIKVLGGNNLKSIIKKYTEGSWSSIFTGFRTTSILQSSSLLSLLVLAFAGAGVLTLKSSIGLIFGANIGSPMLPLLAALIGFGSFKISAFAFPLLAVGGLSFIFNLSEKREHRAKLLIGFGLLFIGLDFMKESMEIYRATAETQIAGSMSLRGYGLLGVVATVVIQSSGALGIMTLTALSGGIITFPASIAIAMGANIGTTFTAVIGSLGGSRVKRQIATSHVLFNVLSGVIGVIFFWQYIWFTNDILGFKDDPIMGNAILNIVFNASTAILFGFFLAPFTKMVEWFVPIKQDDIRLRIEQAQMSKKGIDFSLAQVYALHEDSKMLINQVFAYNSSAFGFDRKILTNKASTIEDILNKTISWNNKEQVIQYDKLKHTSDIMLEYLLPAKTQKLHSKDRILLDQIEATIYANTQSAKSIKNICQDIQDISSSKNKTMKVLAKKILSTAAVFYKHVANIIDKDYDKKNFEELTESLRNIKKDHQHFIGYLTEEITSKLSKEELEELNIPTLLNLDQYLYQSAKKLVTALQNTYLEAEEEKVFKKLKMVEEG